MKNYYVTTPIFYASGTLHIGNAYPAIAADTMARYKRMRGYDVFFLTGTDEHGQKVEKAALAAGKTPQEFVDVLAQNVKQKWEQLDIGYDYFIRTTDQDHKERVQQIFQKLYDNGDIYKGKYEGWYCTPCEAFFTEHQLLEGKCPDCGREVGKTSEECYFFKLSKYGDRIIEYIERNPEFVQPESRKNEMLNNFLRPGLEDLCVSRTSFKWGIPVPFDPGHVIYVWPDALNNYITALGYPDDDGQFQKYWPADVHLVGKEILRFHVIIWPAMLMSLNLPLPGQIFGHGWLLGKGGVKLSKSRDNSLDPDLLCSRYGSDAVRYFLLRELTFGSDGVFSNEALLNRINYDLANDLGNLVSRSVAMAGKYFGGKLPSQKESGAFDDELMALALQTVSEAERGMDKMAFSSALTEIFKLVSRANKYIDETTPWLLAKSEENTARLAAVLYNLLEVLRIVGILLSPFMPRAAKNILTQLGIDSADWESAKTFGLLPADVEVGSVQPLFPRLDVSKELAELADIFEAEQASNKKRNADTMQKERKSAKDVIDIAEFAKTELRVCEIRDCVHIEGSDKLLKLTVDLGDEQRQVVSGIAQAYKPEDLLGKKVILVCNLKPAKIRGVESFGMILAADGCAGEIKVLFADPSLPNGAEVH